MKCERCQTAIESDEDKYEHYGKILCEDCYMDALDPPQACDPAAVTSALNTRRQMGQTGTDGLTSLQKKIYNFVKDNGEVEKEELKNSFGLPPWEIEKQFAILRHCELLKGKKIGNKVYMTTF